jgi:hypothetical protein
MTVRSDGMISFSRVRMIFHSEVASKGRDSFRGSALFRFWNPMPAPCEAASEKRRSLRSQPFFQDASGGDI